MSPAEVGVIVKSILGAWSSQSAKIDREAMTLAYIAGLLDLDAAAAARAVRDLSMTEEWIPTIAKIRAHAVAGAHGRRRSGGEAWGDVLREVSRVGHVRRPELADPIAARAVRDLGWHAICASSIGDASIRARFIELYDHLATLEYREAAASPGAKSRSLARTEEPQALGGLVLKLLPAKKDGDG